MSDQLRPSAAGARGSGPSAGLGSQRQASDLRSAGPERGAAGSCPGGRTGFQPRGPEAPRAPAVQAAADGGQSGVDAVVPAVGQETARHVSA